MEEEEKEKIIILDDEVKTPPVILGKKELPGNYKLGFMNPALNGATVEYHKSKSGTWKAENYIVGQRTTNDKQFCEPVDPLDLHNTAEIRKYITAVEIYTDKAERNNLNYEAKNRTIKYVICFLLGSASVFWALYAGMINFNITP